MTDPTPKGKDVVGNSQPVNAVPNSYSDGPTNDAVAPTTATPPTSPVLSADDKPADPNAPTEEPDTSSDVVGGPAVITEADVADAPVPPAPFEGTTPVEDRVKADAEDEAAAAAKAAESAPIASAQLAEDLKFRNENPDSPVVRAANPAVGGERF